MLKMISNEQDDYLLLLEKKPELIELLERAKNDDTFAKAILSLTSEEIDYLDKIFSDSELKEQFGIVFTYDFISTIKERGYEETLKIISDFADKIYKGSNDRFKKLMTIIDYMEYLLYYDDIMKFCSQDISEESIMAITELKKEIEENGLAQLHKDIEESRNENQTLTTNNEKLLSTKEALSKEIERLKKYIESLQSKNEELGKQINDRRLVLSSNLDEEITAEKIKRQAQIDSEIKAEKEKKNDEIKKLNEVRNKLLLDLQQIESKLNYYGIDSKYKNKLSSEPINDVEVIWEPISEDHEIYLQNFTTIEQYFAAKKAEYQRITGKSESECTCDFLTNCPIFGLLIKQIEDFNSLDSFTYSSIKNLIESKTWNEFWQKRVNNIIKMLKEVKLPRYIIKDKTESIWKDNLEQYLALLDAKANVAKAEADKRIAEAKLDYFVRMASQYIPNDINFEIPNIEEHNTLSRIK